MNATVPGRNLRVLFFGCASEVDLRARIEVFITDLRAVRRSVLRSNGRTVLVAYSRRSRRLLSPPTCERRGVPFRRGVAITFKDSNRRYGAQFDHPSKIETSNTKALGSCGE